MRDDRASLGGGKMDLEPDQAVADRVLQHPRHLEAADTELLRDLDLGLVLQVEQPGYGCCLHQLRRTRAVGADAHPCILPGAHRRSPTLIEEAVSTGHACPDPLGRLDAPALRFLRSFERVDLKCALFSSIEDYRRAAPMLGGGISEAVDP